MKITTRIDNALKNEGINPEDSPNIPDEVFLKIPNFGKKSLKELRKMFPRNGIDIDLSKFSEHANVASFMLEYSKQFGRMANQMRAAAYELDPSLRPFVPQLSKREETSLVHPHKVKCPSCGREARTALADFEFKFDCNMADRDEDERYCLVVPK